MALLADNAADRVEQLIALSHRLIALIEEETALIESRQPLPQDGRDVERNRLVNVYRLEMARIKQEPALIAEAPPALIAALTQATAALQTALSRFEQALEAVRLVSEGLLRTMAEAAAQIAQGPRTYAPSGQEGAAKAPPAVALNQRA